MTKTIYVHIEYYGMYQKKPADYEANITLGGVYVQEKYTTEFGFGDPGEASWIDVYDYFEFGMLGASYTKVPAWQSMGTYYSEDSNGAVNQP